MRTGVRSSLYSPPGATTEAPGTDLMSTYSFVLLTFNHERFVERAVKSALEQEGPKIEVLISDDCSTDSTVQRIESVLASTPTRHSVQFLKSSKNRGISGHWADLAGQFTGERLVYADGDDESRSDRVLRLDELWNGAARGAQLIHSDATAMDEDGRTSGPVHSNFEADPVRAVRLGQFPLGATCAFEGDVLRSFPRMSQRFSLNDIVWGVRASLLGGCFHTKDQLVRYRECPSPWKVWGAAEGKAKDRHKNGVLKIDTYRQCLLDLEAAIKKGENLDLATKLRASVSAKLVENEAFVEAIDGEWMRLLKLASRLRYVGSAARGLRRGLRARRSVRRDDP